MSHSHDLAQMRQRWFLSAEGQNFVPPTHDTDGRQVFPTPPRLLEGQNTLPAADAYADDRRKVTATILNAVVALQVINPVDRPVRRAVDIGAGYGGPTFALSRMMTSFTTSFGTEGQLEAVERSSEMCDEIIGDGILPASKVHQADAVDFLEANPNTFDLATAFMLGPDTDGSLARRLFPVAQRALTESGLMLVTSDVGTVSAARQVCRELELPFTELHDLAKNNDFSLAAHPMQDVLIIPKAPELV